MTIFLTQHTSFDIYCLFFTTPFKKASTIITASVLLIIPCIVWSEVSAQCSDPLIYKLNDIHQFMTNITAKQERQDALQEKQVISFT